MHSTHSNSLYPPYLPGKLEELRHMFVNMDTDDSGTYSKYSYLLDVSPTSTHLAHLYYFT